MEVSMTNPGSHYLQQYFGPSRLGFLLILGLQGLSKFSQTITLHHVSYVQTKSTSLRQTSGSLLGFCRLEKPLGSSLQRRFKRIPDNLIKVPMSRGEQTFICFSQDQDRTPGEPPSATDHSASYTRW